MFLSCFSLFLAPFYFVFTEEIVTVLFGSVLLDFVTNQFSD